MLKLLAFLILLYFIWERAENYFPTSDVYVLTQLCLTLESSFQLFPKWSKGGLKRLKALTLEANIF